VSNGKGRRRSLSDEALGKVQGMRKASPSIVSVLGSVSVFIRSARGRTANCMPLAPWRMALVHSTVSRKGSRRKEVTEKTAGAQDSLGTKSGRSEDRRVDKES